MSPLARAWSQSVLALGSLCFVVFVCAAPTRTTRRGAAPIALFQGRWGGHENDIFPLCDSFLSVLFTMFADFVGKDAGTVGGLEICV